MNVVDTIWHAPTPEKKKKIHLNFYFHTSLWRLKRFYDGLQ